MNTSVTEIAATAREQQATASEIAATTTEIGATSREISSTSKKLVEPTAHDEGEAGEMDVSEAPAHERKPTLLRCALFQMDNQMPVMDGLTAAREVRKFELKALQGGGTQPSARALGLSLPVGPAPEGVTSAAEPHEVLR